MTEQRDDTLAEAIEDARRQAVEDQRWKAHLELHDLAAKLRAEDNDRRWSSHHGFHKDLGDSIDKALVAVDREQKAHITAHDDAHQAHEREHKLTEATGHERRDAHAKEHVLEGTARDKAEGAVNQRLEGMNEVRAQLKDQALTFARVEVVQALTDRVIAIEKLDIKGEGRSLGQGAVIAAIVGVVSFASILIGLIVVLANVLTSPP